jgi:hypothetical protein
MILQATHTHLYPGHKGEISGPAKIVDLQSGRDCLVAFSDGSVACASLGRFEDAWHLHTKPYRTAAGTDIAEKQWLVELKEEDERVVFRILAKAQ